MVQCLYNATCKIVIKAYQNPKQLFEKQHFIIKNKTSCPTYQKYDKYHIIQKTRYSI